MESRRIDGDERKHARTEEREREREARTPTIGPLVADRYLLPPDDKRDTIISIYDLVKIVVQSITQIFYHRLPSEASPMITIIFLIILRRQAIDTIFDR